MTTKLNAATHLTSPQPCPAAPPRPLAVQAAIDAEYRALPTEFAPRTRHWNGAEHYEQHVPTAPAGAQPVYCNRLILEASPYLGQHAFNPVDWRPWGLAAFDEARALGRPIFLSIGYSTCHWCHVMEHESFEDVEIAAILNELYVPIKVDREERPDVDAVYMSALQATSGHGGWPMSVWLLPGEQGVEGLPFFCGTYFPPRQGVRGARQGFDQILLALHAAWQDQRPAVAQQGEQIAAAVRSLLQPKQGGQSALPECAVVDVAVAQALSELDPQWGGRHGAPKFPSHLPIRLLLAVARRRDRGVLLAACSLTLRRMTEGGIHDHVGGGWHRYSTDFKWFAPHFEKMLYDQALITLSLLDLYAEEAAPWSEYAIRRTLDYLLRELRDPAGPFYAATDADSEGSEGWFFTWPWAELGDLLGDDLPEFAQRYQASDKGNFFGEHGELAQGRNLLHCDPRTTVEFPPSLRLVAALETLRTARAQREPPLRDDKVLCSWNGLAIAALARAGFRLGESRYVEAAIQAADGLLEQLLDKQGVLHRSALGGLRGPAGFLDDYAFLVAGLLDLLQATGEVRWLRQAALLQTQLQSRFGDPQGGWFQTALTGERLLARPHSEHDGAEPSGSSVAAANALRLYRWTDDPAWLAMCDAVLRRLGGELEQIPLAYADMLRVVEARQAASRSVVLVLPMQPHADEMQWVSAVTRKNTEFDVALIVRSGQNYSDWLQESPLLRERPAELEHPCAYVCRDGVCSLPARDMATLLRQLG